MTRLFRVLVTSLLALMALGCGARFEGRGPRSPSVLAADDNPEGMWAYTQPGELPHVRVVGGSKHDPFLPLEHTDVAAIVRGHVARVRVTQTFYNDRDHTIEVTYTFPLPENSAVDDMRMVIGERVVESEVQTREHARATFAEAREAGHTAALLEQERPNVFTQSVTNVPPGERIEVEIEYLQTLSQDGGTYEFVFPMVVGPRFIPGTSSGRRSGEGTHADTDAVPDASRITPPIAGQGQRSGNDVSLSLDVHAGIEISKWIAPTHTVTGVSTPEGFSARLADAKTIPNRDFVMRWQAADATPRATLFLGPRDDEGAGHFTLLVHPPALDLDALVGRREMIFVVDRSGSMGGIPLALAKQTLRAALRRLRPVDTFNVIGFANGTEQLFENPRPANEHNLVIAERFIDGINAGGGTYMNDAVSAALRPRVPEGVNRYVFFLTDGFIGNENEIFTNARALVKRARRAGGRARVFGVGIGSSPNRHLIDDLSDAGHAIPLYVSNREHPGAVVERYYHLVDHPVLEQLEIDWGGLEVTELYPSEHRDLFASHAIVMLGRYARASAGSVTLRARVPGHVEQVELPVTVVASEHDERILSTLWAREKIADLSAASWDGALSPDAARAEITRVGLDYHLVTAYTSLVAVDQQRVVGDGEPERVAQPVEIPEDVDPLMSGARTQSAMTVNRSGSGDRLVREIVVGAAPVRSDHSTDMAVSTQTAKNLPLGTTTSRDFTAVIDLVPSATRDAAGISLAGTTGAESKYSIDGVNITNPAFGTVGAAIIQEFVQEVEIKESGYEAEYGGAAGGQVMARRVSGTNRLRGEAGVRFSPRLAAPRLITATDEALRVSQVPDFHAQAYAIVSGPIHKDKLFFTVGVTPSGTRNTLTQSFYNRVDKDSSGGYEGCPHQNGVNDCVEGGDYMASEKFAEQTFKTGAFNLAYVAGLDWRISPRHELKLSAQGGPDFRRTSYRLPTGLDPNAFGTNPVADPLGGSSRIATGIVNDHFGTTLSHSTIASLGYAGRLFDDRVEIDANLGFSQFVSEDAWRLDNPKLRTIPATQAQANEGYDLYDLLERDGAVALVPGVTEACADAEAPGLACPTRAWLSGGLGEYDRDVTRRLGANLKLTHYFEGLGHHRLAWGGSFEWVQRHGTYQYSGSNSDDFYANGCDAGAVDGGEYCYDPGTGAYTVDTSTRVNNKRLIIADSSHPGVHMTRGFGTVRHEQDDLRALTDERGAGVRVDAYDETLSSLNYGVFLQDKWAILSNLYLSVGVRWELQDMRDIFGVSKIFIWDNVAPRLGLVYDWTDEGRSRLYASYGQFYQPLPLQLNSRVFGGLVHVGRSYERKDCDAQLSTVAGVSHPRIDDHDQPTEYCVDQPSFTTGLNPGAIVPRLRGQYNHQLQLGYEHEVIEDLVVGVRWLHSGLGRAVEDISTNGGQDFMIANPGEGVAQDDISAQQAQCQDLEVELDGLDPTHDQRDLVARELQRCNAVVDAYGDVGAMFDRPERTYDAWTVHLQKRFARNWLLLASYTYSRLIGNYEGYVDPLNGSINVGASAQYDLPELVLNSHGPLSGDTPHSLKLDGFYTLDLRRSGRLTLGTSFRFRSGMPISLRTDSSNPNYRGAFLNYLFRRGAGGRVQPYYQWNLSVAYAYPLPKDLELELNIRVFNVTNAKATLRVDEIYSYDAARPIAGGSGSDLSHAKTVRDRDGFFGRTVVTPQGNFGVATQVQQPLSAQVEVKLRF